MAQVHEIDFLDPEIEQLTASLRGGKWALGTIGARFRAALINELSSKTPEFSFDDRPNCFLASALYRGTPIFSECPADGKKAPESGIFVIDCEARLAKEFWNDAVKAVTDNDAVLGLASDSDVVKIERAVNSLGAAVPELGSAFLFVTHFVVFESENWIGSSQPHYSGCIFLNKNILDCPDLLVETIVHELAHQEFFCLNLLDRIVLPDGDFDMQFAPFQSHDRPTIGRMHAAHALYRTYQYQKIVSNSKGVDSKLYLRDTLRTFSPKYFTKFGTFLISECYASAIDFTLLRTGT